MKRRGRISASDLLDELSKDPAYIARVKERDERIEALRLEYASEDSWIAREAQRLGYAISSVWDFVNNAPHPVLSRPFVGPYTDAYPMLVKHLRLPHHPRVREGIIRALTVADGGNLVETALFAEFQSETNLNLKWVLANALKVAMPYKRRRKYPEIATTYRGHDAP